MTVPADLTAEQRHDLIIDAALSYMEHQDWYCSDEDDDPEVLQQLEDLYTPDLRPTPCSGSQLFDSGVTLALMWEAERRAEHERALPVWTCDCGAKYKREQWALPNDTFYTITEDGLFDEPVGSLRGKRGIGGSPRDERYPTNNGSCPACARPFKTTIERQANPQMSLILG